MATPTIRQAVYGANGSATVTATIGSGTQAGDLIVAIHQTTWREYSDHVAPQGGGWNSIALTEQGGDADVTLRAWYKWATSSGSQTIVMSPPSQDTDTNVLMVFVIRGNTVDPNPIDGTPSTNDGPSGTESVGSITTVTQDALLIAAFGGYGTGVQYTGLSGGAEVTNGLILTKRATSHASMAAAQALTSSGATGSRTAEMSRTANRGWAGLMFAIAGPRAAAPIVSAGADVIDHIEGTAFVRTATEDPNGAAITARSWQIVAGPTGVGTTISTTATVDWTPHAPNLGSYTLRYSATNAVGTTTDDMQIEVIGVPVTADLGIQDAVVDGPAVTAVIIPAVRTSLGIGDIVSADGLSFDLTKQGYIEIGDVIAEGPPVNAALNAKLPAPQEIVVEPLQVDVWGRLLPGDVEVSGPPIQVSYSNRHPGGLGGLVAIPPSPTTRFIVQNILTKQFLHWDLPLNNPTITYVMSGPTTITGDLSPEDPAVRELLDLGFEPWSCWIHVEVEGLIRASGILQPYQIDDEVFSVEATGPSSYPSGIPYLSELSAIAVDPADVVRNIWAHIQSYPDGNLGVTVNGTTPVRIGEPEPEEDVEYPEGEKPTGPYKLSWWEGPDCGREIDALAQETPFDYIERCAWNESKTDVKHWIELYHPRAGARRNDLRFAVGENITGLIPVEEEDGLYASQVLFYGKGEGRDIIRGYAGRTLRKRLRRVAMVQDSTVASQERANALANAELERRQGLLDISDIEVEARHPNAPVGSYSVGDDILIDVDIAWIGRVQQYERIISITYSPDSETVRLQLRRAEAFRYGGS